MRGRPLLSTDGRGPSLTFEGYPAIRSKSRSDGREDWVDKRVSSEGRGNSSRILRGLRRPELESVDIVGDRMLHCDSLGLSRDGGALELARDGGGLRSGDVPSLGAAVVGGTTVASDL